MAEDKRSPSLADLATQLDAQQTRAPVEGQTEELTKTVRNKVQGQILELETSLDRLAEIGDAFDEDFLTLQGRVGRKIAQVKDFVGISDKEDKELLSNYTDFRNNVDQFFNIYRKQITGAQASVQELNLLKESLLNTSQTPAEFQASFKTAMDFLQRGLEAKKSLLSKGIRLDTVSESTYKELFEKELEKVPTLVESDANDLAETSDDELFSILQGR